VVHLFLSILAIVIFSNCVFNIPRDYVPIHKNGRKIPLYKQVDKATGLSSIYHKYKFYSKIYDRFMVTITHNKKQKKASLSLKYRGDDWIFFDRIIVMNDKKDFMVWKVHNLDQEVDLLKPGKTIEQTKLHLKSGQIDRLEKILEDGESVRLWLMGQEDAVYSISDIDRLANLDVIKYYKGLELESL
tara:strand:- start:369 stop:929 length:561 start_codon:yes stop_codon:yes gene_type:complete